MDISISCAFAQYLTGSIIRSTIFPSIWWKSTFFLPSFVERICCPPIPSIFSQISSTSYMPEASLSMLQEAQLSPNQVFGVKVLCSTPAITHFLALSAYFIFGGFWSGNLFPPSCSKHGGTHFLNS